LPRGLDAIPAQVLLSCAVPLEGQQPVADGQPGAKAQRYQRDPDHKVINHIVPFRIHDFSPIIPFLVIQTLCLF
jgi:hypothetical protein